MRGYRPRRFLNFKSKFYRIYLKHRAKKAIRKPKKLRLFRALLDLNGPLSRLVATVKKYGRRFVTRAANVFGVN